MNDINSVSTMPGLHRVHADAVLPQLVGRALHEHLDAGLARAVRAHEPVGGVPGDRRHADDRAAAAAGSSTAAACLIDRNVPTRFRSTVARHAAASDRDDGSAVQRPTGAGEQDVEARPRSRPRRRASTSSSTVTSVTTYCTSTPGATGSISSAASLSRSSVRPAIVTCAPSAASRFAVAQPDPAPAARHQGRFAGERTHRPAQSAIVIACFGHTRAASSHFARSSSGGSSCRT